MKCMTYPFNNYIMLLTYVLLFGPFSMVMGQKKKPEPPQEKKREIINSGFLSALTFRSVGPAVTSGRISDFAVNPRNQSEYYVATASGGVWKTTNRGITYTPVFDGEGSYSIGCVTMDPSNPSVIWVGTGENNNQRSVSYGDGVYKSEDGGKSWKNMGLKTSEHIAKILVDPTNSDIVYVSAYGPLWSEGGERGVYKTTDGGKTWKCVKEISKYTGCNDLIMDPKNSQVLYAAFHQRMRKVYTYIGGGPESALYKSIDGGTTWTKLENGLPGGDLGRIGIDISPVNPDIIYAVVEGKDGKGGVYRSVDRGASWNKQSGVFTSGNYYQELTCDPHDQDKLYITDTWYKVSYDGGKTFSNLGEINKHIDNHVIWIDPKDPNHFLVGCDGGIYETFDHAGSYDFKANLPVTQFYKVSTDNATPFYGIHGGTQDNLSLGGPSRTTSANGIVNADWYVTSLGDGFETQVDPQNADIIYAQSQYGGLVRFDKRNGEYLPIKPVESEGEAAYRWNWDAPLTISRHNHKRLYFGANKVFRTNDQGNSWEVISPDLSRQIDRNKLEVMGRVWSVDAIAKNGSTDIFGQTTSIAESSLDDQVLWVGTDDGLIHLTRDQGKTWTKFDNLPGVPSMSYVHQIIASQHDVNTAYVCFNHHRYGDFKPYVLKTTDSGKTWTSVVGNLPERGSVYTIAEDHKKRDLLFVGTEFGCFVTLNGGQEWMALSSGLPTIAVRDIEIQQRENDLVLATFGRGFYVLDDYSPLRQLTPNEVEKEALIFDVKDALMFIPRFPLGLRDKGHLGSSYFSTPNPDMGAVITWYLKDDLKKLKDLRKEREKKGIEGNKPVYYPSADSLRMEDNEKDPFLLFTIKDEKGNVVRHLKEKAKKGLHRMTWDLRTAPPDPVVGRYTPEPDQLFGSAPKGHLVPPGKYSVTLSTYQNGVTNPVAGPVSFQVNLLNESSLPASSINKTLAFCKQVSDVSKRMDAAMDQLRQLKSRVKNAELAIQDMSAPAEDLLKSLFDMDQSLLPIEKAFSGDRSLSGREFETTPSISERLGTVMYSIWDTTSDIPATHVQSFNLAVKQMESWMPKLEEAEETLKAIEKSLTAKGAPHTPGRR